MFSSFTICNQTSTHRNRNKYAHKTTHYGCLNLIFKVFKISKASMDTMPGLFAFVILPKRILRLRFKYCNCLKKHMQNLSIYLQFYKYWIKYMYFKVYSLTLNYQEYGFIQKKRIFIEMRPISHEFVLEHTVNIPL